MNKLQLKAKRDVADLQSAPFTDKTGVSSMSYTPLNLSLLLVFSYLPYGLSLTLQVSFYFIIITPAVNGKGGGRLGFILVGAN